MEDLENCLSRIGYRQIGCEPESWRVSRSGPLHPIQSRPFVIRPQDPALSAALRFWLKRLGEGERSRPYRISPVLGG
jgi:hypothetical protein